ncbi:aliphatic sulfonates import ATP-binding protein SsuB 1 [Nocardia neocaledoniensis NBRC 108232]|uniref:Sulfonate transport system ATP-binding protein n=1 Tax=Nocardia neocaledoniensis TaxID=236511 RepID=A0A317NJ08_9NOCA|nr:ATP-binding cassette domain-containing protein [Nocardia neocaledoniensis]PWV75259.1 sulfonate transport system ATP-binding protein [Nocardia neocaledoniensis]GEM32809.1 aliphatic sulfonates import ATP-binding protein SsuB 1 [Nocardia neocaledoniensis NBRC 108232]
MTTTTAAPVDRTADQREPVAVSITGLRKTFGTKTVLDGVDLTIRRGEFVVLLGPSGTGKTTLLRLLTGLETPDAGEVLVPSRRTTVYQEPRLIPSKRVLANVLVGLRRTRTQREAGLRALREVHLDGKAGQWPATLSGGEAQRAALARALVREPELLLLDEPFAALDALTRLRMQDLVGDLVARHRPAVLMVTHDVDEAIRLADRVIILDHGRFAVDAVIDLPHPREHAATETLGYRTRFLAHLGVGPEPRSTS